MENLLLRVFQSQVADQCRFALTGAALINEGNQVHDQDRLWTGCQMFVVGAGNTSKALWGDGRDRPRISKRRQPLRESLAVDDNSPLYSLDLRNHFEHYDERIERWWASSTSRNHLDRLIGKPATVSGIVDTDMFRVFDPSEPTIYFWGERYALQPIASECDRIYRLAQAEAAKPHC